MYTPINTLYCVLQVGNIIIMSSEHMNDQAVSYLHCIYAFYLQSYLSGKLNS